MRFLEDPMKDKGPSLRDFPTLQGFTYVFEEILGFPSKKDLDFSIYLAPKTIPISKNSYRMGTP